MVIAMASFAQTKEPVVAATISQMHTDKHLIKTLQQAMLHAAPVLLPGEGKAKNVKIKSSPFVAIIKE